MDPRLLGQSIAGQTVVSSWYWQSQSYGIGYDGYSRYPSTSNHGYANYASTDRGSWRSSSCASDTADVYQYANANGLSDIGTDPPTFIFDGRRGSTVGSGCLPSYAQSGYAQTPGFLENDVDYPTGWKTWWQKPYRVNAGGNLGIVFELSPESSQYSLITVPTYLPENADELGFYMNRQYTSDGGDSLIVEARNVDGSVRASFGSRSLGIDDGTTYYWQSLPVPESLRGSTSLMSFRASTANTWDSRVRLDDFTISTTGPASVPEVVEEAPSANN